ncbi:dTMP kinase [Alteromonas oceanisediminis]|uniref:dTMP kinase n=1 Tax=Alteromonas oceanisediminis TaxID=2836180 RepID=UPI001BDA5397|nr:dTMP kinase [Alteromonas oceanisediminis]MBT0586430.1 dTMP kinase [Alteromonas oceanisediminis]
MNHGKFIVVEGLEGAGKSSVIALIMKILSEAKVHAIQTREPGGTPLAEALRECVKQSWQEQVTTETELMLMYASRSQLLANVIFPAINKGWWVVGDRHDLSSQAYQGGGRGVEAELLSTLRDITLKSFRPDLTVYLDVDPATGLERARGRGELDRIEQSGLSFFERTREAYLDAVKHDSNIVKVDAMQPMKDVHADVSAIVTAFLTP